jgi:hypothetical protein
MGTYFNNDIDYYVKDSSIYFDPKALSVVEEEDNRLYVGIVREVRNVKTTNELRYMVEIFYKASRMIMPCRMMRQFGGVYNYDDFVMRGYNYNDKGNSQNGASALAGDAVLVGKICGNAIEGIILGSITHPARGSFLDATKGPQYRSEFNGIETSINEDGEWTLTFKGQPTNLDKLKNAPDQVVPAPEYDTDVGTSYMKWDKEGGFTVSDEATDGDKVQKIHIDKKNGTIDIFSGKINLNFKKDGQKVSLKNKDTTIESEDIVTTKTKKIKDEATTEVRVKTPLFVIEGDKIRLGEEGASEWVIIGSTFRKEQKKMDGKLKEKLTTAKIKLSIAKALFQSAGSAMSTPIFGAVAAGPIISNAATMLGDAGDALGDAADAIDSFENNATDDYLSKVTKTK